VGKQNNTDPDNYSFSIAKLRWEFLRRHKKYNADYLSGKSFPNSHWFKKYGIYPPFDPSDNFPKSAKNLHGNIPIFHELSPISPIVIKDICNTPIIGKDAAREQDLISRRLNEENKEILQKVSTLTLLVDITHRERLILSEFKKLISYWR
jgi:hypothetical protein